MPSTSELLQAITGMQQNAQAALPVIPNNGNPQGANNMPASAAPAAPAAPSFSWLNPSPSMDLIQQMLAQPLIPAKTDNRMTTQPVPGAPAPMVPPKGGIIQPPNDIRGPVLPAPRGNAWGLRNRQNRADGGLAVMPRRGQDVMPQTVMPFRGEEF